jgi:hypothetical protein
MTMRRTVLQIGSLAVALVLFSALVLALWPHPSAITPTNAEKIQKGMTLAEVEELLGGAARNESDLPDNFIQDAFVVPNEENKRWASRDCLVIVEFDASGEVIVSHVIDLGESLLDRLRAWTRL